LLFGRYLRSLVGNAWGLVLLLAGFVSTAMTFVPLYMPQFHLPRWIPIFIAIAAFLLAPFRLYRLQEKKIAELVSNRQPSRRAALVLKAEGAAFYIRMIDNHTNRNVTGLYVEPRVTLENKGTRNAVIESYDLHFPEIPEIQAQSKVKPHPLDNGFIPALNANHGVGGGSDYIRSYIDVPAEKLIGPIRIPFVVLGPLPAPLYEKDINLQCLLTVRDTEGNTASASMLLSQRG
jgi:hypothetical protein